MAKQTKPNAVSRDSVVAPRCEHRRSLTSLRHRSQAFICPSLYFTGLRRLTFKSHRQKWQKHFSKYRPTGHRTVNSGHTLLGQYKMVLNCEKDVKFSAGKQILFLNTLSSYLFF